MIPKKRKELTPEEAFTRLAAYCAYAEHSPHEVRTKCKTYGISGELYDELIERLESEGYLNEERFARAFVRDKYRFNGWGPLRLQAELRRHRIASHIIDAALEELDEEEIQGESPLLALLERKYRSIPQGLPPRKVYERLTRFALYRGYPYEEVREAISELLADSSDDLGDD